MTGKNYRTTLTMKAAALLAVALFWAVATAAVLAQGSYRTAPADTNGDGRADIVRAYPAQDPPLKVYVDGRPVLLRDMPFVVVEGAAMVPIRPIVENMGGQVRWSPGDRQVEINLGIRDVDMTVGSTQAYRDGLPRTLSTPPTLRQGRVLVPLQEISRLFDVDAQFNGRTNTAFVTTTRNGVRSTGGPTL